MFNVFSKKNEDPENRIPGFYERITALSVDMILIFLIYYYVFYNMGDFMFGQHYLEAKEEFAKIVRALLEANQEQTEALMLELAEPESETADKVVTFALYKYLEQIILLAPPIIGFTYYYGHTPGKYLFNMKVVDSITGEKVTFVQTIVRFAAFFISLIIIVLAIPSVLIFLFSKKNIFLHDYLANTKVVFNEEHNMKNLYFRIKDYFANKKK